MIEQTHTYRIAFGEKQVQSEENCQITYTERYVAVMSQNNKQILYYCPLSLYKLNQKMFHPEEWSLKDFQIGRHLGKGAFGHVYLAREKSTKLIVALKTMEKRKILQQDYLQLLRRELEIHSHLKHENILHFYGFFHDEKKIYIILDYAPGGNLYHQLIKAKGFPQEMVKRYMKQMVSAFIYLQQQNIIHRDIKPENILISSHDTLKLSDFGWSIKTTQSQRRTFCGTPEYFCPELVRHRPYDYKIDNWSLGILAYELVVGQPPFHAKNRNEMYNKIVKNKLTFPKQTSQLFQDFVGKLLQKNASERIELVEAINHPWLCQMDLQN